MTTMDQDHGSATDVFVKEECQDEESLNTAKICRGVPTKQIDFSKPTAKCGEVLVACTGKFSFVCILCCHPYQNLEAFGIHIREHHMRTKSEEIIVQPEEDKHDPLNTSTIEIESLSELIEENHYSEQEFETTSDVPSDKDESDLESESPLQSNNTIETESVLNENVDSALQTTNDKDHVCNVCGRGYMHRRSYLAHIKKAHVQGKKPFKPLKLLEDLPALNVPIDETTCKYCDQQFEDTDTLQEHLNTHTGRKRFVCRYCLKTFSCRTTRLQHLSTHTGERHYKCPHCPKTFSGKSNLTSHIRAHLKIKNYSCDYCDKRFVQSSEKKVHELTHTGEKPHQCEECGQRYPTSNKLNEHLRRHKNIKNYKCEICGKAFYGLNLLKNHMPTHTGEKPFSCNICGQSFPRKKSLKTHKQLHSGEKNYVCNKCGKAFAQFAGLYSHMKSHGEKPR